MSFDGAVATGRSVKESYEALAVQRPVLQGLQLPHPGLLFGLACPSIKAMLAATKPREPRKRKRVVEAASAGGEPADSDSQSPKKAATASATPARSSAATKSSAVAAMDRTLFKEAKEDLELLMDEIEVRARVLQKVVHSQKFLKIKAIVATEHLFLTVFP